MYAAPKGALDFERALFSINIALLTELRLHHCLCGRRKVYAPTETTSTDNGTMIGGCVIVSP